MITHHYVAADAIAFIAILALPLVTALIEQFRK